MKDLTKREVEVLEFADRYTNNHGFAPSTKDIGDAFKITRQRAHQILQQLQSKGRIKLTIKRKRNIKIV